MNDTKENKRRVVITGLGVVAPSGIGKQEFWENTIAGKSWTRKITRFDASQHPSQIAAEIDNFDPKKYMDPKQIRRTDLSTQYAMGAAKLALIDAKLNIKNEDPERIGLVIGIAVSGMDFAEKQFTNYRLNGLRGVSTFTTIAVFCCASVGQISIDLGIVGYNNVISTGCTAGTVAIGNAYTSIQQGIADIIFAGGTEAPIAPLTMYSFCAIKALSTRNNEPEKASRPFDKERDGFVMGEGSGIVIMEELEHAIKRNAHIYAEVIGYGTTCNAYHMTAPAPDGVQSARAMKIAMKNANIKPENVDYIQAHGSSTQLNEKTETLAIKKAFGEYAYKVPISGLKSMIGHSLGPAGAFQTITNCLIIEDNIIPPTINYEYPDPECDLDYVPNKARKKEVNIAMQNSSGFSGVNAVLLLKKYL
ncbi:MAG: beta-ketoacyl-ACP synthase II [Candidatus Firestonebacteria bacterium]